jgi:hypothetical protein
LTFVFFIFFTKTTSFWFKKNWPGRPGQNPGLQTMAVTATLTCKRWGLLWWVKFMKVWAVTTT